MFRRLIEMPAIAIFLKARQQRLERRADVAYDAQVYRGATSDLFASDIDLRDAHRRSLRIELSVGEVRPQHQQHIAIEHGVVARREANQPRHADVVGVLPFNMLLAPERMHHGGLQPVAESKERIMRALTSTAAQYGRTALAVQKGC